MKALNRVVLVVGILTFVCGLIGVPSAAVRGPYVVAGAILIAGGAIAVSIASRSQSTDRDEDKKGSG